MARNRSNKIEVDIVGEADFGRARRDAARDLSRIEKDAESTADDIKQAFDRVELSPELDKSDIREALDLAEQLDGMVARLDVDTDLSEIQEAERIARSLRAFQGRVDLSVEGRQELTDALGLADKLDAIRTVKVQVQGQRDLERARDSIRGLGDDLGEAGDVGAEGIGDALEGIDFDGIGQMGFDQMSGALAAAGPWGALAAGIGAIFGDELVSGFDAGFNKNRQEFIRTIQSGASEAQLAEAGRAAGTAWTAGFGESIPQLRENADELISVLGDVPRGADLGPLLKQAELLSDVLGVDVTQAAETARRSIKLGLADDVQDAFNDTIGVVQEFGDTGREALDVYDEFGPNFARFEIDGGRAVRAVATAYRDGLIPTIDRFGEAYEEVTTRIVDGDALEALEELGLNFQDIQQGIAEGGPAANDALQQVIQALLDETDAADQARLSNIIFGTSFEQVNDKGALLEVMLGTLTDQTDAYNGKAEETVELLEAQVSPLDRAQRGVSDLATKYGELVSLSLGWFFDYRDAIDDAIDATERWLGVTEGETVTLEGVTGALDVASRSTGEFGAAADEAADDVDELGGQVGDLRNELERLAGFQADQLMRDIADAGDDLADAFENADAGAVGLNGEINISSESGRRLQARLEGLTDELINTEVAFGRQEISAGQARAAQAAVRAEFDRVTGSARLTTGQVEALRRKYIEVRGIGTINTVLTTEIRNANQFSDYLRQLNNIPSSRTTTLYANTVRATTTRRSTANFSASGGPASGLTVVGEEGPELLDLPGGSFVHSNPDSRRMIDNAATSFNGGGGGGGRAQPTVIEIRSGGSAFDDALVEVLRKTIQNRGGNVQAVLG